MTVQGLAYEANALKFPLQVLPIFLSQVTKNLCNLALLLGKTKTFLFQSTFKAYYNLISG